MGYRLEWCLLGHANRPLDQGEIDGDYADQPAAFGALNALLLAYAVRGRNPHEGYWWGRRSADADMEFRVTLRTV